MDKVAEYTGIAEALLDYVDTNTTDQADKIRAVPAEHYTDPARWAREVDLIFKRLPLLLALTAELPKPGDFKAMDAVGLPVLISRGKDGVARAFLNACLHRGAPIAEDGAGNCNRFTCPYHGWTYANDGRLIGVADRHKFGDFDKTERHLTALPCEERAGMIFVVLTPGLSIDLPKFLGGMLNDLEQLGLENYHYCGSKEITGANWKVAFDGYLEGYHFAMLHPQTIHPRTFSNVMHYEAFGPHLRIGFASTDIAKLHQVPKTDWWKHENNGFDFVRTIFPGVSIFLAPEIGQIGQILPGATPGSNRTILNFISARPPETEEDTEKLEQMKTFLRDVVRDEDYAMGDKVQKGLESGALSHVMFGKNERGNQLFHEWVDYYVSGGGHADANIPIPHIAAQRR